MVLETIRVGAFQGDAGIVSRASGPRGAKPPQCHVELGGNPANGQTECPVWRSHGDTSGLIESRPWTLGRGDCRLEENHRKTAATPGSPFCLSLRKPVGL